MWCELNERNKLSTIRFLLDWEVLWRWFDKNKKIKYLNELTWRFEWKKKEEEINEIFSQMVYNE